MEIEKNPGELREKIAASSGKSTEEILQLIDQKKEKFSGLLTDSGAAFMIAKELGVAIEKEISETTKINALKEGMNNVDVEARLKRIYPPKEFEKNGKKGKLQNLVLWDGNGEVKATLWNKDVDKFNEKGIQRGACLKMTNCSVSAYNEVLQLNLNYNSSFDLLEKTEIPEIDSKVTSITDLDSNLNDVSVKVTIKKIFPAKEFENDKGTGKVMNFFISEGVNEIRATAWNEVCDQVDEIGEGEVVTIEGAYTKEGRDGVELHLGWSARIVQENSN